MKKFSKIENIEVNREVPKKEDSVDDKKRSIKYAINQLIEEFLKIRIYGPIDPILEGTLKIEGKDEFISSIINLFKNEEVSKTLNLLQEAKYRGIDSYINIYESKANEVKLISESIKHQKVIKQILERSNSLEKAIKITENMCSKINDKDKCYYRHIASKSLINETENKDNDIVLEKISNIFLNRFKNLSV